MGKQKIQLFLLFFLSILILSNISTFKADVMSNDTLQDIYNRGYLIVGSDTTYPPFEEYNSTSELAQGFDIDIAHQIAIALGVKLKIVTFPHPSQLFSSWSDKFDHADLQLYHIEC